MQGKGSEWPNWDPMPILGLIVVAKGWVPLTVQLGSSVPSLLPGGVCEGSS